MSGLALAVPSDAPLKGRAAPLPMRRAQDPGWDGRDAVYLPWTALEWPG